MFSLFVSFFQSKNRFFQSRNLFFHQKSVFQHFIKFRFFRSRKIDFRCLKRPQRIPRTKQKIETKLQFSMKIHTKAIFSSETIILSLLKLLKPIKTDRKSIVDSGSLDITSGSRLKWPFMPKQGPRSSTVLYSTVQYWMCYSL